MRYSYLWLREHRRGREEGGKNRPCAVLLSLTNAGGEKKVVVLPITHARPDDPRQCVEIPAATNRRLGLDDERSWIVLRESHRFTWPGPDLRPVRSGKADSVAYGLLPRTLFEDVRSKWLALFEAGKTESILRTD